MYISARVSVNINMTVNTCHLVQTADKKLLIRSYSPLEEGLRVICDLSILGWAPYFLERKRSQLT